MSKFEIYCSRNIFCKSNSSLINLEANSTEKEETFDADFGKLSDEVLEKRKKLIEARIQYKMIRDDFQASEQILKDLNSVAYNIKVASQVFDDLGADLSDSANQIAAQKQLLQQLSYKAECKLHYV